MPSVNCRDDLAVSGGRIAVLECLKRVTSAVCRSDRTVRHFYIGIASGETMQEALQRRHDDYKKEHGINEMILLYKSSSRRFCAEVEDYLITYFVEKNAPIINRRGGRGGRPSSQPYHYVYLAVLRRG